MGWVIKSKLERKRNGDSGKQVGKKKETAWAVDLES
jgi:hypothetical protein